MRKTDFDSKLLIYRSRQILLMSCVFAMTIVFSIILVKNLKDNYPWYALAIPFMGMGLLFLFVPLTEEWEYKPWQSKPRRVEQQNR